MDEPIARPIPGNVSRSMPGDIDVVPNGAPGARTAQPFPHGIERRQPYSPGKRAVYGTLWATWTFLFAIAGFTGLFGGQILGGLLAFAIAGFAGRYDYRIWTWRARRLLFFVIW